MRRPALVALALAAAGCASGALVRVTPDTADFLLTLPADARPRVTVHPFEVVRLACACGPAEVGGAFADILETELMATRCFHVLERRRLAVALEEQDLGTTGRVAESTAPPVGALDGAEWVIVGTVTDYAHRTLGLGAGVAVGDHVGGAGFREATVGVEVRVIDAASGRLIFGAAAQAYPREFGLRGFGDGTHVEVGAMAFYRTPLGDAVREALRRVADALADRVSGWHGERRP